MKTETTQHRGGGREQRTAGMIGRQGRPSADGGLYTQKVSDHNDLPLQDAAGRADKFRRLGILARGWKGRRASAGAFATIAVIVGLFGGAPSAAAEELVGNLHAAAVENVALNTFDLAQAFETGSNVTGYQLEALSIDFADSSAQINAKGGGTLRPAVYVYLYEDNGSSRPGEQVAVLTKDGLTYAGPETGVNKYKVWKARCYPRPPHGGGCISEASSVHLEPGSTYWVYVWAGDSDNTATVSITGNVDRGAAGWTIANDVLRKPRVSGYAAWASHTSTTCGPLIQCAMFFKAEGKTNPAVLISISDATATEGTDPTMDFVVTLSQATSGTVTVEYLTVDGTAESGSDFQAQNGTLTFQPGETSKTISVPIVDDTVNDNGETFNVLLTDPKGAGIDKGSGTGTILNTETLTGNFESVPADHDGSTAFTFYAAFTTDIAIGYAAMRDHAFTVTKGDVTKARRVDGRSDRWEITVDPDGDDAVTVTLPGNRACGTQGAICSKEDNPVQLSNNPSATIAGPPAEPVGAPLTASFSDVPDEHNGSDFTFQLTFSEEPDVGWRDVKGAVRVSNGSVNGASRKTQGSNLAWNVKVRPTGTGSLTITLPETTECSDSNAICTANGRQLSHSTSQRVQGLVGISIADGEVEEAAGARVIFRVSLSEAASQRMTVDWATSDGTAQAGSDYQNTTGSLTFLEGHTSRDVDVQVYDDEHNEGSETFTVTLSNTSTGRITDATATGTITNHDALPAALTARFGRTAAVHIVEQVEERVNAPRAAGFDGRVAGREINSKMGQQFALDSCSSSAVDTGTSKANRGQG